MRVVTGQRFLIDLSILRKGAAVALIDLRRVCIPLLIILILLFFLFRLCLTSILVAFFETHRNGGRVGALCFRLKNWRFSWRRVLIMHF